MSEFDIKEVSLVKFAGAWFSSAESPSIFLLMGRGLMLLLGVKSENSEVPL